LSEHDLTVTVGLATLDRYPYVETLLDDLAAQTRLPDAVLIVDQTSPRKRRPIPTSRWSDAFPIRVVTQDARGTTKARNRLLQECRTDIILQADDDSRIDADYVENHVRHFGDDRVDVVTGPVYEWDKHAGEWYVKWHDHLMIGGWNGAAFPSALCFVGTNNSIRVERAVAIGGWDENIVTHGEDGDFMYRLNEANGVTVFDPNARLRHLRAPRGGERAAEWGVGPEGNWQVLAGYLYHLLANRPMYDAWAMMVEFSKRPFWHIKHGRIWVGLRLMPRVLAAIPVSLWRWSRGRLLIDPASSDRQVRRFSNREMLQLRWRLAADRPRTILPDRDPPQLPR
jgi:cellulose synthase/poly-beta-1,6-N-acetylglucosamine synthase-like glycosyltransferase